jgi:hypothetical protein
MDATDALVIAALVLVLLSSRRKAASTGGAASSAPGVATAVPAAAIAPPAPVPTATVTPVTENSDQDENDADTTDGGLTLSAATDAQIEQEISGSGAPSGPPPIPTESSVYSAAAGYDGWTPALAQENIDALFALSQEVNTGQITAAQFQAIVQAPGYAPGEVPPPFSAYSDYYD